MQGKSINGYMLQRQLGIGGMAEVWLAENAIGKKAAVKLLLPKFCNDEAVVARFENEAKVMVRLDHPNIRQVYDYGIIEGRPCIVMEYLEGEDLKTLMKNGRRFTDEELRLWWNQIADALNYTHAQGIIHRDIKPSNLFLNKKGNIKLLDFGIAKVRESISMTQTGLMLGTLMYMSPEQVDDAKHLGPKSDVYSLAVTFVHLLTGKAPYDSTNSSDYKIRKGIVEIPLDLSAVPVVWQGFLAPYLEKKPEDRPALRPFEVTSYTPPTPDAEDETVTIEKGLGTAKGNSPTGIQPNHNPENKKRLWMIFAAVAIALLLLLLLWPKKEELIQIDPATEMADSLQRMEDSLNSIPLATVESQASEPIDDNSRTDGSIVENGSGNGNGSTTGGKSGCSNVSVSGSANGHDYVDLGLPSGTLWATCNIGANKPEYYGSYFAWGETSKKGTYNWDTYKYANGAHDKLTKYCNKSDYGNNGFTDNLTELQVIDDPATANWGNGWRTPTKAQWDELLSNTNTINQWTTQNGVKGRLFTSKKTKKTLFIPAAGEVDGYELNKAGFHGYYWSRSLYARSPGNGWNLSFTSDDCSMESSYYDRCNGYSVRPVHEN